MSEADSQELLTVSYSELDTLRQCPFKHQLAYVERWQTTGTGTGALDKGTLWHLVLEAHYRSLMETQNYNRGLELHQADRAHNPEMRREKAIIAVAKQLEKVTLEGAYTDELIELVMWMYQGYLDLYGIDEQWTIVAVEHTAIVPLYETDGTESRVRLKIKIDLLVRDARGRLWIVDHKSGSRAVSDSRDMQFDDQFGLYTLGMRRLGYTVTGSIHNAATTNRNKGDIYKPGDPEFKSTMKAQRLEDRMQRTPMNRTDAELAAIEREALDEIKAGYSPNNKGQRRPNTDTCKWRCSFTEACIMGRRRNNDAFTREMLQETGFTQDFARH